MELKCSTFLLVLCHLVICVSAQNNLSLSSNLRQLNDLNDEQQLNVLQLSEILQDKVKEIRNNELGVSLIQVILYITSL